MTKLTECQLLTCTSIKAFLSSDVQSSLYPFVQRKICRWRIKQTFTRNCASLLQLFEAYWNTPHVHWCLSYTLWYREMYTYYMYMYMYIDVCLGKGWMNNVISALMYFLPTFLFMLKWLFDNLFWCEWMNCQYPFHAHHRWLILSVWRSCNLLWLDIMTSSFSQCLDILSLCHCSSSVCDRMSATLDSWVICYQNRYLLCL